ncbi:hypothetical protein GCM10022392_06910 [Mucilaginibacter panaciglaebae]|uniref:6-bladed beta-propeller protein n=2 Tax=Mucilaginibacter panaciglaebae TaxID=502331 RepID=A0ABP7WG05_9SPHI
MACNSAQKETTTTDSKKIKIDLTDTSAVDIKKITDTMYTVSLHGGRGFDLSPLVNFFFDDNRIIIADRMKGIVYLFNQKGLLLNTIHPSKQTNALNKIIFKNVTDVFYDDNEKLIEILDRTANAVFRFKPDGKVYDTLSFADRKALGFQFVKSKDRYVNKLLSGNADRRDVGVYYKQGQLINYDVQELSVIRYMKYQNILLPHPFDVYKDSIYYIPMLGDKIYNLSTKDTRPEYKLDYPDINKLPTEIKVKDPTGDIYAFYRTMNHSDVPYNNSSLFINDNWVSFKFNFHSKTSPRNVFYSKKNKKVLQFSRFKNNIDDINPYAPIIGKYKNYFVLANQLSGKPSDNAKKITEKRFDLIFFKLKNT